MPENLKSRLKNNRARAVAQLVELWPSMYEALGLIPSVTLTDRGVTLL